MRDSGLRKSKRYEQITLNELTDLINRAENLQ